MSKRNGQYFPTQPGEVFAKGKPPKGTCPRPPGRKLARKAREGAL